MRQTKKVGSIDDITAETQAFFDAGHKWEAFVIEHGMEQLDLKDKLLYTQGFYTIEELKLAATPDAVFSNSVLIEAKCTGAKNKRHWEKAPPIKYAIQAQVQLMVTNATHCYIVGVFFQPWPTKNEDGLDVTPVHAIIYKIVKNKALQKKIIDKVNKFWYHYDMDDYRYVVPSFEKEEIGRMVTETSSFVQEMSFNDYLPHNSLTSNDKQIIRQVALEAALKYLGDYMTPGALIAQAKTYMNAYMDAIDQMATVSDVDPTSKGTIIALQSALKRAAELKVSDDKIVETMVRFATFTITGN